MPLFDRNMDFKIPQVSWKRQRPLFMGYSPWGDTWKITSPRDLRPFKTTPGYFIVSLRMVKLGQRAASRCHCKKESPHGVDSDAIALRQVLYRLVAPWCELPC
jgi:hypothetical protein